MCREDAAEEPVGTVGLGEVDEDAAEVDVGSGEVGAAVFPGDDRGVAAPPLGDRTEGVLPEPRLSSRSATTRLSLPNLVMG